MSLQTLKKKVTNNYMGVSISGRSPGGIWVTRGPFRNNSTQVVNENNNGFSLNGGHRNIGHVGKTWLNSKVFTPYRGAYAKGYGGCCGHYYQEQNVFPIREVDTRGTEYKYIKPSVLSNKGMLELKYQSIWNGQYPCNIVSPEGNDNLINATNGVYAHTLASANMCVTGTHGRTGSIPSDIITHPPFAKCKSQCNIGHSKTLFAQYDNSTYAIIIQQKCANPTLAQEPIPGPKNGNSLNAINLSHSGVIPQKIPQKCNVYQQQV